MSQPLLQVCNIDKFFGAVEAVRNVSFELSPGEILGLIGDNGAGKSTLIKVISGVHEPTAGQLFWKDQPKRIASPKYARNLGIETIYQDLALAENLSIAANIFLGKEVTRGVFGLQLLNDRRMEETAKKVLDRLEIQMNSYQELTGNLSGGQKQAVAITRAILWGAELIIMDEPTAALGVAERSNVLRLIRKLKTEGIAVILISHNLNDVLAVTDRVVILQRGRKVGEATTRETSEETLVWMMLGSEGLQNGNGISSQERRT